MSARWWVRAGVRDLTSEDSAMTKDFRRTVRVTLTEDHVRKIVDDHLLREDEIGDSKKLSRVLQQLIDSGLGLPEMPWHDWDDWEKGLE
jgi:hypothetical protein